MNPETAAQKYKEASRLYLEGKYAAALEILNQLERHFPRQRKLMLARAHCLAKLFRPIEAVVLCDRILARYDCKAAHDLKMRLVRNDGIPDDPEEFAAVPLPEPDPFFKEPLGSLQGVFVPTSYFWRQVLQIGGIALFILIFLLLVAANFGLVFQPMIT